MVFVLGLAWLPSVLQYVTLFLSKLIGQLVASSIIDAAGFGRVTVPLTLGRMVGLGLVCIGYSVYQAASAKLSAAMAASASDEHSQLREHDDMLEAEAQRNAVRDQHEDFEEDGSHPGGERT